MIRTMRALFLAALLVFSAVTARADDFGVQHWAWIESTAADNAVATATRSAVTGSSHYITSISASYDGSSSGGELTLDDGATTVGQWHVEDRVTLHLEFPSPIKITVGTAASLSLEASGTGGTTGTVNLMGFTR